MAAAKTPVDTGSKFKKTSSGIRAISGAWHELRKLEKKRVKRAVFYVAHPVRAEKVGQRITELMKRIGSTELTTRRQAARSPAGR